MTAQVPEVLILDGERTAMAFCPPLPFGDPRFGVSREELALRAVAARIAMDSYCLDDEVGEFDENGTLDPDNTEHLESLERAAQDFDAIRAKRIAEALEEATGEMPAQYHSGETHLSKRTTVEELSAAVDAAEQEGWDPPLRHSGCWRGYQGTWEIRDSRFFLVEIDGTPSYVGRPPILADWFTGELRIPRGRMLQYHHMGFASQYEAELHIRVDRGVVKERRLLSARELGWASEPARLSETDLSEVENPFSVFSEDDET